MKVLIVDKESYIGGNVGKWFASKNNAPEIEYVSARDDNWKAMDMTAYDVVIFFAAIVHRKDVDDWALYKRVNADLPYEFATKAKESGVKHFIFLSTAAVFPSNKSLPVGNIIDQNIQLLPTGMYGKSKLLAEQLLQQLASEDFCVSIIRPMNVYGKGCRGNYVPMFTKITRFLPFLPCAFNDVKQGMIYIDNLSELCWLVANSQKSGVYMAQDANPISTYEMMDAIAAGLGLKKRTVRCAWLFRLLGWMPPVCKLFGGVAYEQRFAECTLGNYQIVDFREGIRRTCEKQ